MLQAMQEQFQELHLVNLIEGNHFAHSCLCQHLVQQVI